MKQRILIVYLGSKRILWKTGQFGLDITVGENMWIGVMLYPGWFDFKQSIV